MTEIHVEGGTATINMSDDKSTITVALWSELTQNEKVIEIDVDWELASFLKLEKRIDSSSYYYNLPSDHPDHHVLYAADPECKHRVEAQWSGVKCVKCNGWYCA